MPICKYCQQPFAWGRTDDSWVPLVPIGSDEGLDRRYQDENGALRAGHRDICTGAQGGPTVRVSLLAKTIEAKDILPVAPPSETVGQTIDRIRAKRKRKKTTE